MPLLPTSTNHNRRTKKHLLPLLLILVLFILANIYFIGKRRGQTTPVDETTPPIIHLPPEDYHPDIDSPKPKPTPPQHDDQTILQTTTTTVTKDKYHMKIVVIDTPETHKFVRRLMGSIHKFHKKDIKLIIYGLHLPESMVTELLLWEHVHYLDIEQEFLVSSKVNDSNHKLADVSRWSPVVIYDALERAGRILYLDAEMIFTKAIDSEFLKYLDRHGSFYGMVDNKDGKHEISDQSNGFCLTHAHAIGISDDSYATKNFLKPLLECSKRACPISELKQLQSVAQGREKNAGTECHKASHGLLTKFLRRQVEKQDYYTECNIIMRDDFMHSQNQLPLYDSQTLLHNSWKVSYSDQNTKADHKVNKDGKREIVIALGVPSTTKNNKMPEVKNLPLMLLLIPSVVKTMDIDDDERYFRYIIYLGFDEGDPFYDNSTNRALLQSAADEMLAKKPIEFKMIRIVNSRGWVPFIWNALFQHSMDDGADYYYQVNDDVRLISPHWASTFVSKLENSPAGRNVGVTGPTDSTNKSIFTQAFAHRTHYEIFGYFFPYEFKNWYSDNWITNVYDFEPVRAVYRNPKIYASNRQTFGTRYMVCEAAKVHLESALARGKVRIQQWLESKHSEGK